MSQCIRNFHRSKDRVVFGVCQGFADHFDLPVVWVRIIFIALCALTFPIALVVYFVLALILKPAPDPMTGPDQFEEDYFETDLSSRTLSLRRLKNKFDSIESRIRRMENYVTNKSYDWERRLNADK